MLAEALHSHQNLMPSLRRSPNSPFWIACLTLPDGRRTNRSTKTTDRRLAQRLADEWQFAARKAGERRLVETQAREILNDILAQIGEERLEVDTIESFLHRWLSGKGAGSTRRRYSSTVELFLDHLDQKRAAPLASVGHRDILEFMEVRRAAGVAPKTLSVDVRTLHAAFNVARKLGLVNSNPVERALAIRPIAVESSGRDHFSPEQAAALVGAAEGDWRTAILLGYFTGARLGDCANLGWQNVDFTHGVIDFEPQKTRAKQKRVIVPIHPSLRAHLVNENSAGEAAAPLCPTLAGKPTGGKNGLSAQFRRIMKAAGVDAQTVTGKGTRKFSRLSFHSLRHSFNSGLANMGVDQETRMAMTGHTSRAVNSGYTHLALERLNAAIQKLPTIGTETAGNLSADGVGNGNDSPQA